MLLRRNAEPSGRWRPSDGKGKVVGLYICTMRRYAPLQYRQVLLRAPTAALYYISNPTTASTFALACCDDFCQRRAKLYLTYCKRAFGKPQSGKGAQQARANAYFFRRSVACIAIPRQDPITLTTALRRLFYKVPFRGMFRLHFASLNMTQLNVRKQNFFPISGCTTRAFGALLYSLFNGNATTALLRPSLL